VAGSAETYQATGPDGEVVVLKVLRDVSQELAADMSKRLEAVAGHPGLIVPSTWGRDGDDFYVVRRAQVDRQGRRPVTAEGPRRPVSVGRGDEAGTGTRRSHAASTLSR
jgi:hypothetical protein